MKVPKLWQKFKLFIALKFASLDLCVSGNDFKTDATFYFNMFETKALRHYVWCNMNWHLRIDLFFNLVECINWKLWFFFGIYVILVAVKTSIVYSAKKIKSLLSYCYLHVLWFWMFVKLSAWILRFYGILFKVDSLNISVYAFKAFLVQTFKVLKRLYF